jgi:signal transduction histidine kinase
LGRVAADAAQSLATRFRHGRIDLEQHLPPTAGIGDPNRLHQVAINLLTNAAKFTPPGGKVVVRTFIDGAEAVLEVTDSGPGVLPGEREVIWERFYQGSAGQSSPGSGIGLAVVKELVDAHGGTVAVQDSEAGGSRFVVRIPAAMSIEPEDRPARC